MCNTDIIELLLEHGHDANYPSLRLGGRPPLFELCLNAPSRLLKVQGTVPQKEQIIKNAIKALIDGGAFPTSRLPQAQNRSLLHHALDSSAPHMMTKCLLETANFHTTINQEQNLFSDGVYTYSATQYIARNISRGDKTQNPSLLALLSSMGATDRFWKNDGHMPLSEMMSPPAHIQLSASRREAEALARAEEAAALKREIEKQQKEIDEKRRQIALEQEIEQVKADRAEQQFRQRQKQEQRLHEAEIKKENDKLKLKEAADAHALRQEASMSKLRNDEQEAEYRRRMRMLGEEKSLTQSQAALAWAYRKGMEEAQSGQGQLGWSGGARRMLGGGGSGGAFGISSGGQRRIEGPRIKEVDEDD